MMALSAGSEESENSKYGSMERWRVILLVGIFVTAAVTLALVYYNFPKLEPQERVHVKLPRNIEDAKELGLVLSRYKDKYFTVVLFGVLVTYIFLQSFAIPGSIFLSIMSGYLFSFPLALACVCTCSAVGAAVCYLLSYLVGRSLVAKYWPDKVLQWQMQVSKHREHLLNYIIFLRITPFLPNWFINIASPVIDVPFSPFFWGTFFGVAPPSFFFIQAGTTLQKLTNSSAAFSWSTGICLGLSAVASLLPVFYKSKLKSKIE